MLYLVNFYPKKEEILIKCIIYMANIFQEEYKEKSSQKWDKTIKKYSKVTLSINNTLNTFLCTNCLLKNVKNILSVKICE